MFDSFLTALNQRLTAPFYGIYTLSWAFFHWNFIYTALFVSEDKIWVKTGLLKNEYLNQTFINWGAVSFYLGWLLPLIVTVLAIWVLPKYIAIPAFRKQESDRTKKNQIRIAEKKKLEIDEKKLEEASVARLEVIEEKAQKEQAIVELDPTALWQAEYDKFKGSAAFSDFTKIIDIVYENNGFIPESDVADEIVIYAHSNGLVEYDPKVNQRIELADKGKFFVKQFTADTYARPAG